MQFWALGGDARWRPGDSPSKTMMWLPFRARVASPFGQDESVHKLAVLPARP